LYYDYFRKLSKITTKNAKQFQHDLNLTGKNFEALSDVKNVNHHIRKGMKKRKKVFEAMEVTSK